MSIEEEVEKLAGIETTGMMPANTEDRLRGIYENWLAGGTQDVSALTFLLCLELWRIQPSAISYLLNRG